MRNRFLALFMAGFLCAPLLAADKKIEKLRTEKLDTLTGEVVDIQCEARRAAKEPDSAKAGAASAAAAGTAAPEGAAVASNPKVTPKVEDKDGRGWNECGTQAVRKGAPVGLRSKDGRISLLVMDNRQPAGHELGKQLGKTVTVAGRKLSEGGLEVFEVSTQVSGEERRAGKD